MSGLSVTLPMGAQSDYGSKTWPKATPSRLSFLAITGVIEVDAPFDPGEETPPSPKADVFPSSPSQSSQFGPG
jgi:hypothetical protein